MGACTLAPIGWAVALGAFLSAIVSGGLVIELLELARRRLRKQDDLEKALLRRQLATSHAVRDRLQRDLDRHRLGLRRTQELPRLIDQDLSADSEVIPWPFPRATR